MASHNSELRLEYGSLGKCICGGVNCKDYGLCHCGCGGVCKISKGNRLVGGEVAAIAGMPTKWLSGHSNTKANKPRSHKGKPQGSVAEKAKLLLLEGEFHGKCYCGCGVNTEIATQTYIKDGKYKAIVGLPKRFIKGHELEKRRGRDNPGFKEVHKDMKGYIKLYVPEHPRADGRGRVFEHILVMEESIGRYLEKDPYQFNKNEIVHHINENPSDNSLSNLKLMTHGDHTRLHRSKKC